MSERIKIKDMSKEQLREYKRDKARLSRLRYAHKRIAMCRGEARFYKPEVVKLTREYFSKMDECYIQWSHIWLKEVLYPINK